MGFRRLALAMFRQDLDWLGLTFYTPTQVELVYNYINQLWFTYRYPNYSQRHASEEHYRTKSLDDAETPMVSV